MFFSKKEKGFREAYCRFYPMVYGLIYTKTKNYEDTEDICHEIFMSFYSKYNEIKNQRAWLNGSIKFAISNYYARKSNRDNPSGSDINDMESDKNLVFENGQKETRILLEEACENSENFKDESEKLVFDLIAINGLSYRETAKQLGITARQAEYKYHCVIRRIVDYLKQKGINSLEDIL